jgi:hypothetical protein
MASRLGKQRKIFESIRMMSKQDVRDRGRYTEGGIDVHVES